MWGDLLFYGPHAFHLCGYHVHIKRPFPCSSSCRTALNA